MTSTTRAVALRSQVSPRRGSSYRRCGWTWCVGRTGLPTSDWDAAPKRPPTSSAPRQARLATLPLVPHQGPPALEDPRHERHLRQMRLGRPARILVQLSVVYGETLGRRARCPASPNSQIRSGGRNFAQVSLSRMSVSPPNPRSRSLTIPDSMWCGSDQCELVEIRNSAQRP